jgi:hypothetical protein
MGGDGNRKGMTLIIYRKRQANVFSYRMTLHGVLLKSDIVRLSTLAGGDKPPPLQTNSPPPKQRRSFSPLHFPVVSICDLLDVMNAFRGHPLVFQFLRSVRRPTLGTPVGAVADPTVSKHSNEFGKFCATGAGGNVFSGQIC